MAWQRWVRRGMALLAGPPLVVLSAALGTAVALLYTAPGRALTARTLTAWISSQVAGRVEIGGIRGSLWNHVVLERVVIADSLGGEIIVAPRVEARYRLPDLMAGRIVIRELVVEQPQIHLVRLRRGRWNYQEVFRSGGGSGGDPSLVDLHDVTLRSATIRVDAPTTARPPEQPMSRHGAPPAQPETVSSADGLVRVYRAAEVSAQLDRIRVSTPARDPILVRFSAFAAHLSDPAVQVVDARGEISTQGDSLRFDLEHAHLPDTRVRGRGMVRWPEDTVRYDFALDADTVALRDLRWIQPDFPDWVGRGRVVALSTTNRHAEFALSGLVLGDGTASAEGRVITLVDRDRGFGVRDLDLALRTVPLEVMRPYLDTLPFRGTLTGRLRADGYRALLQLGGELQFVDALTPLPANNRLSFQGGVRFGGEAGAVFDGFTLRDALLELATVRVQVPAMVVPGRLRLVGRLDGPWQDVAFVGTAEHVAPNDAVSRLIGTVRFDTRGTVLGLGMDARFDRLSFDGLRTGYPGLTLRGGLTGHVVTSGRLDSLDFAADVTGDVGDVVAHGVLVAESPRLAFRDLVLDVRRLDLEALRGRGANTALSGRMTIDAVIDSGVSPVGTAVLDLGQSRFGGVTLNGIRGVAHSDGRVLRLDSTRVEWPGGGVLAHGGIGWNAGDSGTMVVDAAGFSLVPFDSLVRVRLRLPVDTIHPQRLAGTGRGHFDVTGSLATPRIAGTVAAEQVMIDDWRLGSLAGRVSADSLAANALRFEVTIDSLGKGRHVGTDLMLHATGSGDALHLGGRGRLRGSSIAIGGWRRPAGEVQQVGIDSLVLALPRQRWELAAPALATVSARRIELQDTITLRTTDGSGIVTVSGQVPGGGVGELHASVVGLSLVDIYDVMGRDTASVAGQGQVDLRLSGTRASPTLRGNAMVTGLRLGDATPPVARAAFDYRDRALRSNLTFWRLGEPVLEVDLAVPFDLALMARERRRLPGALSIRATADSADLAILEAFTRSVRSTTGTLSLDLGITGTWESPRLEGSVALGSGRTTIPALGVRYGPMIGSATFAGDSMVIDTMLLSSGEGDLHIGGSVRFEHLTRPLLNLELRSDRFLAIDVPGFMVARPTGQVTLTGPVAQPVLRGTSVTLTQSDIYFADIITKEIIDLEDPRYREFVDIDELRRLRLGTAFQNRFLDSLRIENLRVVVGPDVWLRSAEAEIQLEGAVQVSKAGKNYVVAGSLNTPRGEYTVDLRGLVSRKFQIDRGTVTYLGTTDLDAELDIQATYRVRSYDGDELPIVARITGSILVPKVELSSPGRNIPELDLVSYLVFGRPESQLASATRGRSGQQLVLQQALATLSGAFEQRVVQESGLGLDLFEIRPTLSPGSESTGNFYRLAAGRQLGPRWFVTVNAGLCLGGDQADELSARNFGASIEYRFARDWRVQASAEPVQACISSTLGSVVNNISRRYQLGADLLWEREY